MRFNKNIQEILNSLELTKDPISDHLGYIYITNENSIDYFKCSSKGLELRKKLEQLSFVVVSTGYSQSCQIHIENTIKLNNKPYLNYIGIIEEKIK